MSIAPIRLLLVDAHLAFRQPLAFMLERERDLMVVAQAGSLAEAREVLRDTAEGIDVAIAELQLPDGNGAEVVREIQAAADACVLVVTADEKRVSHALDVEAGACGVIGKASPLDDIIVAVRRVHAGEQLLSPRDQEDLLHLASQAHGVEDVLSSLTGRERQVLEALAAGLNNRAISERLAISPETARSHVVNLLAKLHVKSRLRAAIFAIRNGIGPVDGG
ncbi:MAG: LuxR C-terminal-related transcriptional regulator [Thermomicrobiales bacterium]